MTRPCTGHNPSQPITTHHNPPWFTFTATWYILCKTGAATRRLGGSWWLDHFQHLAAPSRSQDGSSLGATVQLPPPQPPTDHFNSPVKIMAWGVGNEGEHSVQPRQTGSHHFIILSCHQEQLDTFLSRYQDIPSIAHVGQRSPLSPSASKFQCVAVWPSDNELKGHWKIVIWCNL